MSEVVELGVDALPGQSPKEQDQSFPFIPPPTIFLVVPKEQREFAILTRLEIEVVGGKNSQCVNTRLCSMQVSKSQRARW